MLKKRVLSILLVLPMMFAACKSGKNKDGQKWPVKVDVSDCYNIEIEGFNEKATLSLSRNEEEIEDVKDKTAKELKDEDMPYREAQLQGFFDSISFVAEPMGNLSNGDVIKIGVNWDESLAEKCSVEMEKTTFSYTVSGLEEVTYIDPFENLVVTISGVEGNTVIDIDNSGCSDIVKQNVKYSTTTQDSFLNIGETVTVQAEWNTDDKNFLDEYAMTEQSKEYVADSINRSFQYHNDLYARKICEYIENNAEGFMYPFLREQINALGSVPTDNGELLIESKEDVFRMGYNPAVAIIYSGEECKGSQGLYPVKDLYIFTRIYIYVAGTISETQKSVTSKRITGGNLILHIYNINCDGENEIISCDIELLGKENLTFVGKEDISETILSFDSTEQYVNYIKDNYLGEGEDGLGVFEYPHISTNFGDVEVNV